jgi:glycosyltransferase involved in cell wall biosynthesis
MKKKILVKAPALSASGYGEQSRFALRSLRNKENIFDIHLIDIPWGRTGKITEQTEEVEWIKQLIHKTVQAQRLNPAYDISLQITIPNEFENIAAVNIGYTAGIETTKVAPQWIEKSNMMDKIIVPSNHSKDVFEQTVYKAQTQTGEIVDFKLQTPVEVCSFPAKQVEEPSIDLELSTKFNFLSVAQWSARKNLEATILNFLKEFQDEEDVGLVLKLNLSKNSTSDKSQTTERVKNLISNFRKQNGDVKCKIHLLHGNLREEEMQGLYHHPKIGAFVTTTHGEGFGLPMLDAACAGLPIIAPAWSSYLDFLCAPKKDKKSGKVKNRPHFVKVDFDLKQVQKSAVWDGVIQADSQWCWVKDRSVRDAMREMKKNHGIHLGIAKKLKTHILENLSEQKQTNMFANLVHELKEEEQKWASEMEEMNES